MRRVSSRAKRPMADCFVRRITFFRRTRRRTNKFVKCSRIVSNDYFFTALYRFVNWFLFKL